MRPVATIARRELLAAFLSPIHWVVLTLFLLIEGYSFWVFVELANGRDLPHGAVLRYFFGGTVLYWLFLLFLCAVISMRLVADERRQGTLEPLLTAPVDPWQVALGKYLGALGYFVALWIPTLLYVVVLATHAPPGVRLDPGPIVSGYLGTLLVGAGALAVGLLASSLTRNQILAAVLSFTVTTLLLLLGALGEALRPGLAAFRYLNLFRQMEDFGRGIVDSRPFVWHLSLVVLGLFGATRALAAVRRRRDLAQVAGEVALVVAILGGLNLLGARHYLRGDWTRARTFELSDKTVQVLRALDKPVEAVVFLIPSGEGRSDLYDDVRELLERARRETPKLSVEYVDPDRSRERLLALGKRYGLSGEDLAEGVVVLSTGVDQGQSKFLTRADLADYDVDPRRDGDAPPRLSAWKGEAAFVSALLALEEPTAPLACFLQGHGEPAMDSLEPGEFGDFAEALRRDHLRTRAVDVTLKDATIPKECAFVVVSDPETPWAPPEVALLAQYLDGGGKLLGLIGPSFDRGLTHFQPSGLEPLFERWGVRLQDNLVVDEPRLRGSVVAFGVSEGYASHPAVAHLMHKKTVWAMAREVRAAEPSGHDTALKAVELARTTPAGFATIDPRAVAAGAEPRFDAAKDVKGPVPLGVAVEKPPGTPRLVVWGSSQIASNREVLGYNRDLLLSSVAWLTGSAPKVAIGPKTPEHLRLELDAGQLRKIFWVCVVGWPLLALLIALGVFWVRRR